MKVITAKTAGFCFGVKRAVDTVYQEIERGGHIYTFGEIIHNEEVVADLEKRGVQVLNTEEELKDLKEGTVIIRSHGVSKHIYEILESNRGIRIVDATCPFVAKIHSIVEEAGTKGSEIVVIGDSAHPEVRGIIGFAKTRVTVVQNEEEADNYKPLTDKDICIVSQTTFHYNKFKELVEIFEKKGYSINTVNTICSATEQRQNEAREIASKVDAMIVIGGRNSSNTRKLYEICSEECGMTWHIQTVRDLTWDFPESVMSVGITAGASTPNYIIEEVQSYVRGTDF